jgi:hypothetical protein
MDQKGFFNKGKTSIELGMSLLFDLVASPYSAGKSSHYQLATVTATTWTIGVAQGRLPFWISGLG